MIFIGQMELAHKHSFVCQDLFGVLAFEHADFYHHTARHDVFVDVAACFVFTFQIGIHGRLLVRIAVC